MRRPKNDPTVVFLHIPKTAGLTLRKILRAQYGKDQVIVVPARGQMPDRRLGIPALPGENRNERVVGWLSRLPPSELQRARCVIGHVVFGLHEAIPGPFTYVTLIRDPIERLLSLAHKRAVVKGRARNAEEYLRSDVARLSNQMTKHIAGSPSFSTPCTGETLERAKANIREHFAVAGLSSRFDETVVLLARTFGYRNVRFRTVNVTEGRTQREDLTPGFLATLEEANAYDRDLYRYVEGLFEERLATERPPIDGDVARLRRKNAALAGR